MPAASVDFGLTADDYSRYRAGFPRAFFDRIAGRGLLSEDTRLLDLGSGTGSIARGMARRGAQTVALDLASPLLRQARQLDAAEMTIFAYVAARAENTPFADAAFDVVAAGQCWHWFDGLPAAREAARILVRGGTIIIAHFDWLPFPGNVVEASEALIARYNPAWAFGGGNGIHPDWLEHLRLAKFIDLESFTFDLHVPYSHIAWRGRIRASAGVGASLDDAHVRQFDEDLAQLLRSEYTAEPLRVPHRVFAVLGKKPPG